MHPLIGKSLSWPLAAKLLLAANIGALLFALTMQFGFGVAPCVLCVWQRVPYASAAVLSFLALAWTPARRQTAVLLGLCAAVYLVGAGLATFHTGIERHWWQGTSGCAALPLTGASVEEMRQVLLQTGEPRCDEISWEIFGFSMASFNIVASLALAFFAVTVTARHVKNLPPLPCFKGKKCL